MLRIPIAAPEGRIPLERRGAVVGRFCLDCGNVYPTSRGKHSGRPLHGRDHVAAPCLHEGDVFAAGEEWWQPAVEVLPPPTEPPAERVASAAT